MKATSLTITVENMSYGGQKVKERIPEYAFHEAFKMAIKKINTLLASEATAGWHDMMFPIGDDGYCTFTARLEIK